MAKRKKTSLQQAISSGPSRCRRPAEVFRTLETEAMTPPAAVKFRRSRSGACCESREGAGAQLQGVRAKLRSQAA